MHNILITYALMTVLFDKKLNLYDVIGEFIKMSILIDKKNYLSSIEIQSLLKKIFLFDIPESVVKTTLKRLEKDNNCILKKEYDAKKSITMWNFQIDKIENKEELFELLNELEQQQKTIIDKLIQYLKSNVPDFQEITEEKQKLITDTFFDVLIKKTPTNDVLVKHVVAFILENKNDNEFVKSLNKIKEGLVLCVGISKHGDNLNNISALPDEITFFLATEHLFSIRGYHGIYFQERILDFLKLVSSINDRYAKQKNDSVIKLKYFKETEDEIEEFFYKAQNSTNISVLLPEAAEFLRKHCLTPSDFLTEKAKFYVDINNRCIHKDKEIYSEYQYTLNFTEEQKQALIRKLMYCEKKNEEHIEKEVEQDEKFNKIEKKTNYILKIINKINILRKGENANKIAKAKYIYVSDSRNAFHILDFKEIFNLNHSVIYPIVHLDSIIEELWFKYYDGLTKEMPKSLDVIIKIQIIFSKIIKTSIIEKYEEAKKKNLSDDEIKYFIAESVKILSNDREKLQNIKETINFIEQDIFAIANNKMMLERKNTELAEEKEAQDKKINILEANIINKDKELADKTKIINEVQPKLNKIEENINLFVSNSTHIIYTVLILFITFLPLYLISKMDLKISFNFGFFSIEPWDHWTFFLTLQYICVIILMGLYSKLLIKKKNNFDKKISNFIFQILFK